MERTLESYSEKAVITAVYLEMIKHTCGQVSTYTYVCTHMLHMHMSYGLITHVRMCMEIEIDRKSKYAKMSIFVMQVLGV